jgi:hypothetical protein
MQIILGARANTDDTAYLIAIFFLMKTFTSRALTLTRFCPKIIYKLFAIAAVLAIKEAYSIQARCRLALASIRTLFG